MDAMDAINAMGFHGPPADTPTPRPDAIDRNLMNLLAIDTSTECLSLAVSGSFGMKGLEREAGQRHSGQVLNEVRTLLALAGIRLQDLEGIAYGSGPGAFTGLRIACGVTQGLAMALGLRVKGIGTLLALAEDSGSDRVIACLDARMGEVYHAAYCRSAGPDGGWVECSPPGLYAPRDVPVPDEAGWLACGSGFAAHGPELEKRLAEKFYAVRSDAMPRAGAMLRLAIPAFEKGGTEEPDQALPLYLRDKVAAKKHERNKP